MSFDISCFWNCLCRGSNFESTFRLTFEPFIFCVWRVSAMVAIWLNNIRPEVVHFFLYAASFSCLFCVLMFRLMNLRLFVGLACDIAYLRWLLRTLLIVTLTILRFFSVVLRVLSWSVYVNITCFFFLSVYSEKTFVLVRVKFYRPFFSHSSRLYKSSQRLCADACDFIVNCCVICETTYTTESSPVWHQSLSETLFSTKTCCDLLCSKSLIHVVMYEFQFVIEFVVINFIERFTDVHDNDISWLDFILTFCLFNLHVWSRWVESQRCALT